METILVLKVSVIHLRRILVIKINIIMQEQIIEKATEMYLTLGFKSVTMDDIANEMGISVNTVKTQLKRAKVKISESLVIILALLSLH